MGANEPRIKHMIIQLTEKITLILKYAQTEDRGPVHKDFYGAMQKILERPQQKSDHIVVMGDWNAKVGKDTGRGGSCMVQHGAEEDINDIMIIGCKISALTMVC